MATTTTTRSTLPKFRYLTAWFCPFAHRATLALEHHHGRVEYEWVEALGWYQGEDKNNVTGTGKEWYYHYKSEELIRVNPSALVPTLIPIDPRTGNPDESRVIWESLITIDYIDAVAQAENDRDKLVPSYDPYLTALCRMWADKVNKECCSPYYGVLVRKDPEEQRDHFDKLVQGLSNFGAQLHKTNGPLFLPDAQLSSVDLALFPWAYRYYVFEHYRGPDFVVPNHTPELQAYHTWYNHMISLPSVQRTCPDKDRYLEHIQKYADGSARSKVANAVRRGVAAHDFDDKTDDYEGEK